MAGGTADGAYTDRGNDGFGYHFFNLAGQDADSGAGINRSNFRAHGVCWIIPEDYYSPDDVSSPDLCTHWYQADDDSLASVTVSLLNLVDWQPASETVLIPGLVQAVAGLNTLLAAASQILLAAPYVPAPAPVLTIPQPAENASLCLVYVYAENLANAKRGGIVVTFRLDGPAKSERMLTNDQVAMTTNGDGYAQIALQRTDRLTPGTRRYKVTCAELGLRDALLTTAASTLDLATLLA